MKNNWPIVLPLIILGLLLARNPFSSKNLISNFEPYPDSFHYLVPPRCLISGNGWELCRPGLEGIKPDVSPLYSTVFVPFFFFNSDPRMFYFANVSMAGMSLLFLYLVLKRNIASRLIIASILLIYVTSYYTYWLPTLAMAENLLLTLFLITLWLYQRPATTKTILLSGLSTAALYGTKISAFPLTLVFSFFFVLKYVTTSSNSWKKVLLFTLIVTAMYLGLGGAKTLAAIVYGTVPQIIESSTSSPNTTPVSESWFSATYFFNNLETYLKALVGQPLRFLWHYDHILPQWLSLLGLGGLGISLFGTKKEFTLLLWSVLLAPIVTLSFFYSTDARYILTTLPILLIGVAFFLDWLLKSHHTPLWRLSWLIFLGLVMLSHELPLMKQHRTQLALNFKYAETPWWYMATQELNTYFSSNSGATLPYVATVINPYYADIFGNNTYKVLPLWPEQDFHSQAAQVWGIQPTKDWGKIYQEQLSAGNDVYLFSYGLHVYAGSDQYLAQLLERFRGQPVFTGCAGACTLYKLSL